MQFLRQRLPTIGEVFIPAWGWIVGVLFLGILGTAQAIHDEILPPETAERYHFLRWVLAIDWKWYALAILAAIIFLLVESINRAAKKSAQVIGAQYRALYNTPRADGTYMLGAVAITPLTNWSHSGGTQCSIQCTLEITTAVAIQYYVSRFEATYEGISCPNLQEVVKLGIATPIEPRIVPLPFINNMPWNKARSWRGATRFTVHYGLLLGSNRYPYRIDCEVRLDVRGGRTIQTFVVDAHTMA